LVETFPPQTWMSLKRFHMLWAQKWSIVLSTLSPLIGVLNWNSAWEGVLGYHHAHWQNSFENITQIPTPRNISQCIIVLQIPNKLLTPLLMVILYMASHPTNLPLIPITQRPNPNPHQKPPYTQSDFNKDFNKDVLLDGHLHNNIPKNPNWEDKD
jgi:hypothetical protein